MNGMLPKEEQKVIASHAYRAGYEDGATRQNPERVYPTKYPIVAEAYVMGYEDGVGDRTLNHPITLLRP